MRQLTFEQLVARVNANGFIPGESIMPQKVKLAKGKEFSFKAAKASQSKYDWDGWFNGDLLLIERSTGTENEKGTIVEVTEKKDFEVPTNSMPPKIHTAARRRYKVCQISRLDADGKKLKDALIIRARPMTDEERAAEDLLRAEEKANRAAQDEEQTGEGSEGEENAA